MSHRVRTSLLASVLFALVPALAEAQGPRTAARSPGISVDAVVKDVHSKYRSLREGKNADYIPALAEVNPELFGVVVVTVDGQVARAGDTDVPFSIQSISKVMTLARVVEDFGPKAVEDKVGVDPTGQVFNSITAIEQNKGKEMNPFVNPGAIATTSLVEGRSADEKFGRILDIHEQFAGRPLRLNETVYRSESESNQRNQAIAMLLKAYDRIYADPQLATDAYTRQCSINVTAGDLGVMAATLANGGRNPMTHRQVVSPDTAAHVLSVMAVAGLYDDAGIWLYRVGLPAKSGVGGGLIAVAPGRFGIAAFSPPLDAAGNSVRAQRAIAEVAARLGANPFLVVPK